MYRISIDVKQGLSLVVYSIYMKRGGEYMDKKIIVSGALAVSLMVGAAGGSMLNILQANAAEPTLPATQTQQTAPQNNDQFDPTKGGHIGSNGKREELLTGDTAEKVKSAALKAVSGSTIERVETDAEGAAYEAHMTKADGSRVTVKLDSNFTVTGTETGPNGPGSH